MHSAKAAKTLILLTLIACPTLALTQNKSRSQRLKHSAARTSSTDELSLPSVSLVSGTPEYLSGEANVTVKGNENPIIRLGLATSLALLSRDGPDKPEQSQPASAVVVFRRS